MVTALGGACPGQALDRCRASAATGLCSGASARGDAAAALGSRLRTQPGRRGRRCGVSPSGWRQGYPLGPVWIAVPLLLPPRLQTEVQAAWRRRTEAAAMFPCWLLRWGRLGAVRVWLSAGASRSVWHDMGAATDGPGPETGCCPLQRPQLDAWRAAADAIARSRQPEPGGPPLPGGWMLCPDEGPVGLMPVVGGADPASCRHAPDLVACRRLAVPRC